jgi:hypothetical protein
MLFDLLDGIDRRQAAGVECSTGEILTALMLPAIYEQLGWDENGNAEQPQGLDVREVVTSLLRPIAVRLRFARKDQETCRMILATLYRMVPVRRGRRSNRRTILQRSCLPSAVWMLEVLAKRLGGDFTKAAEHWKPSGSERQAAPSPPLARRKSAAEQPAPAQRRRRRGRRPSASKQAAARQAPAPAKPGESAVPGKSRQWDDDYFFSALPTVPEMAGEENERDRYGAAAVRKESKDSPADSPQASDATPEDQPEKPKPRRRRRPRRRRKGGASKPSGDDD